MCDKVTTIAYRHSPEQVEYNINGTRFKEYSKNWRQCIYIDTNNGNFVTSRQYPREDRTIAKATREFLEETISNHFKYNNTWKAISDSTVITEHMMNYDIRDWNDWDDGDGTNALHYNDIWYGFNGKIIFNKDNDNLKETEILVGCEPICPICGERKIEDHNYPVCDHCYCVEL